MIKIDNKTFKVVLIELHLKYLQKHFRIIQGLITIHLQIILIVKSIRAISIINHHKLINILIFFDIYIYY